MANEKTNQVVKPKKDVRKVKSFEMACSILTGGGVPLNHKDKTQTWIWDRTYSPKVIAAGAFLDSYKVDTNEQYKTLWYTEAQFAEKTKNKETV